MKILYDYQIFEAQKYGGISRYFVELAKHYNQDPDIEVSFSAIISDNEYLLNNKIKNNWTIPAKYIIKKRHYFETKVNRLYNIFKLRSTSVDIVHPTYYDPSFLNYIGDTPFVLTIHDMIHEKFPHMFSPEDLTSVNKKILAQRATKIIAISESTKNDIIDILQIEPTKIHVIFHGNSMILPNKKADLNYLPSKYILFVGNRTIYKNFNRFIKAIAPLLLNDLHLNVVCAGGGMFSKDEEKMLSELNIDKKVYQYNIDDNMLPYLYKKAEIFAFPSLYEGFGIPLLEAFACTCPVVCSNTSSLPEVAGDAAMYFDPYNEESIKNSIEQMLNNKSIQTEKINKGIQRLKNFSWEKTAHETKMVYKEVLNA